MSGAGLSAWFLFVCPITTRAQVAIVLSLWRVKGMGWKANCPRVYCLLVPEKEDIL